MIRTSRRSNSKFNLHSILKEWFYTAYPFELYEIPDSKEAIEEQIKYIYNGLLIRQSNKMEGVFMARKRDGKKPSTCVQSTEKKKTGRKYTTGKKKTVNKKKSTAVDRRIYICELLIEKRYTDERIMSMVDRKFKDLEACKQSWVSRLRGRLNNDRYPDVKFRGTIKKIVK